jgi:hypothetical protein
MFSASSNRAAAQPNRAYRGERLPTMASSVLAPRYISTAGAPPTTAQNNGATWASEVFSATDSSAARVKPVGSSADGSRPHSDGSSLRAPSMSSAASRSAICRPVRASDVPPRATNVATAVVAADPAVRATSAAHAATAPTSTPA